jgi:hypothetical protein
MVPTTLNFQKPLKSSKTIDQGAENQQNQVLKPRVVTKLRFTHHEHGVLVHFPEPHNI